MSLSDHCDPAFLRLWGWPLALAALSVFGLLSALLGQGGIWWPLSWLALAIPLVVILGCIRNSRRARRAVGAKSS